jgi:hypothetical protein
MSSLKEKPQTHHFIVPSVHENPLRLEPVVDSNSEKPKSKISKDVGDVALDSEVSSPTKGP